MQRYTVEKTRNYIGNIALAGPVAYFASGGNKGSLFGDLKGHGHDHVLFYTQNKTAIHRWW